MSSVGVLGVFGLFDPSCSRFLRSMDILVTGRGKEFGDRNKIGIKKDFQNDLGRISWRSIGTGLNVLLTDGRRVGGSDVKIEIVVIL